MSLYRQPGRHELGQNALTDRRVIRTVIDLVGRTDGPIVEWGAGNGALTAPLAGLGRPLEAVEIDQRKAVRLSRRVGTHVCIVEGDILRHAPPAATSVLVSNVPFHITTRVLRRLLALPDWQTAVLITQWEVARKRAGVGGATQLTAQWWPWFDFTLHQRIPSNSFTPRRRSTLDCSPSGAGRFRWLPATERNTKLGSAASSPGADAGSSNC